MHTKLASMPRLPFTQVYGSPALDAAWCELTKSGESPLPGVVAALRSAEVPPRMQVGLGDMLRLQASSPGHG